MNPPRLRLGLVLVGLGAALGLGLPRLATLGVTPPAGLGPHTAIGDPITLSGVVAPDAAQQEQGLVVGTRREKKRLPGHDAPRWALTEEWHAPFPVDTPAGRVWVDPAHGVVAGKPVVVSGRTADAPAQWSGLRRGDALTASGTLTTRDPPTLTLSERSTVTTLDPTALRTLQSPSRLSATLLGRAVGGAMIPLGLGLLLLGLRGRPPAG